MLLLPHPHLSRSFIVTITCTVISLFHQTEGFPVLVEKAGAVLGPPPQPLPNSDASWFDDSAVVSTLVTRSSADDVVHDGVFIPTIVTMGVLVIICIFCFYRLIVSKGNAQSSGANNERPGPIFSPQYAVGQVDSNHGSRALSRRGSVLSASRTIPGSPDTPSMGSNMLDRLQRRREEEHRQLQQQDPYEQYMSVNQGYPYPQQHYQYTTPHPSPSVPGSVVHRGEGVQPQLPRHGSAHAQPPLMNVNPSGEQLWAQQERQNLQQSDPRLAFLRSSVAQTSSTRVSSDVLSYMTPPEARRLLLPNNSSQPQILEYPAGGIPLQAQPSTQGDTTHSGPANHTPRVPSTTAQATHVHDFDNQPPGYSTETTSNNVQENTPYWKKEKS